VNLDQYDVVHVAGGQGATYDLFPNEDVARTLEHFWSTDKVVGALCHGAISLGNIPDRVKGRQVTGYSLEGDKELERFFGPGFFIPHYPQKVLEDVGTVYSSVAYTDPRVVVDGKLITGQNQQSASEYAIALLQLITGESPVAQAR
jgi:putative intracellular protease/amidase